MIIRDLETTPEEPVSHDPAIMKRVLLRKGEVANVMQVAEATFLPGQIVRAHAHVDMSELFLCRAGTGLVSVRDAVHALRPGIFVGCQPGESHEIENTGSTPLVLLVVGVLDARTTESPG